MFVSLINNNNTTNKNLAVMIQTVKYSENIGLWTITIGTRSKTAFSMDEVNRAIDILHNGIINDNK